MKIHQKLKKDQYTTDRLAWYQRELTGTPINKPKFWVCIGLNDGKEDGRKVFKKNCYWKLRVGDGLKKWNVEVNKNWWGNPLKFLILMIKLSTSDY